MKWLACIGTSLAGVVLSSCAWAHEEAAELGHHWACPGYTSEMRLQTVAMAVLVSIIALATLWMKRRARL